MVNQAKVNLYGRTIGYVAMDQRYAIVQFEYDRDFTRTGIQPAPLMMPAIAGRVYSFGDLNRETFKGLPGMLADSLPDTYGRALFEKWLALTGRTSSNVLETLCYLGKRCMGALEFEPAIDAPYDPDMRLEIDSLVGVAREALLQKESFSTNLLEESKAAIAEILRLGTSAGGQRAKAIIAYNKSTGEVRSGQIDAPEGFDYYIIKLDGVSATAGFKPTENFGRLEYSFSKLVKECGIDMTDCDLIEENGRSHFLTKRFDRNGNAKVHMQTLCAIAHYDYRLLRGYSYEQAFNVMRRMRLPYADAQEMFRRIVFNVAVRNQDDHTKNISFLMDKMGKWRLSPAYDMGYAYNPKGDWTSAHQMSINEKFNGITRQDLIDFATKNNIKSSERIIDDVCETVTRWPSIAKDCDVPKEMVDEIFPKFQLI